MTVSKISVAKIIQVNIATSFVILQSTEPSQSPVGVAFHVRRGEIQEAHRPLVTWGMKTKFVESEYIQGGRIVHHLEEYSLNNSPAMRVKSTIPGRPNSGPIAL